MYADLIVNFEDIGTRAKRIAVRLALALLVSGSILMVTLSTRTVEAANVGNCDTIAGYPQYSFGKIRWDGMSQCFAMYLEHGYTVTVTAGDRSFAGSSNVYEPLGDSVLVMFRSKVNRIQINDPFNASYFEYIGMNDDYARPEHLGSRLTFEVTGERGRSTLFVARVSGFNGAVGTYSISVTRSVEAVLDGCEHIFSCQS